MKTKRTKHINFILIFALVSSLFFGNHFPGRQVLASEYISQLEQQEQETQNAISNLQKQTQETQNAINSLQNQKAETESNVKNLKGQSASLQSKIDDYSEKMGEINSQISEAEEKMAQTSSEILAVNQELTEAQEQEKKQYELLKKQIKNTYERGGENTLISVLLSSRSMQDFLTKAEYVEAIVAYDKKTIAKYQTLQKEIEEKKAALEEKQSELDSYQDQLDEKQGELADLTDDVMSALDATNGSIASERSKLADFDKQLTQLDQKMKNLESQVAAAQAALARQIAERQAAMIAAGLKEDLGGSYAASAGELEWLAATIQAEADGESYTGKLAVGTVIMNRVKSSSFPNSIVGVITQNMQFASYRSGKVELIMSRGANSTCVQAAQEVLSGARVGDYLFFMTKYYADYYRISEYVMIGNHAFFYRWVTKDASAETPAPAENPGYSDNTGDTGGDNSGEDTSEEYTEEYSDENSDENGEEYSE